MKHFAFLSLMVLGTGLLAPTAHAASVYSQTDKNPELTEHVEFFVSALRAPLPVYQVADEVDSLDREEIENLPAGDPGEALSYLPGVDMAPRTKFGHLRSISIRGSVSRHVLVLFDGIPFNTQASGQADILPTFSLRSLERIEVIKGGASSAWGSSLGGVVHLLSRDLSKPVKPETTLSTVFSEFHSSRQEVESTGEMHSVRYNVSASYSDSGGARTKGNTSNREDTLLKRFFGKWRAAITDTVSSTFSTGYNESQINEGIYQTSNQRQEVPYSARFGEWRFDVDPSDEQHLEASLKMNRQHIQNYTFTGNTGPRASYTDTHDNFYGLGLKSISRLRDANDSLILGWDVSTTELKTTLMTQPRDIFLSAPYAEYLFNTEYVTLSGGARYDSNEEFGEQFSPSVGAVWRPWGTSTALLRAKVSRVFHAPPLLWKYFRDVALGVTGNNPEIQPERAWTYETGFETQLHPRLKVEGSIYRSDVEDAIAAVRSSTGLITQQNFQEFRQQGVELGAKLEIIKALYFNFSGGFIDVKDEITGLPVRGRGVPRENFQLGLEYAHEASGATANILGTYDRWDAVPGAQANDRKFIFDAHFMFPLRQVHLAETELFVNIYNLTNSKYWNSINFPLPERYFEGGVSLRF